MSQDLELAFLNTMIAFKLMAYSYSLKTFFKDEFKKGNGYVIPFSHVLFIKRNVFPMIRDCCDYVCPYREECDGHKFLILLKNYISFNNLPYWKRNVFMVIFIFTTLN